MMIIPLKCPTGKVKLWVVSSTRLAIKFNLFSLPGPRRKALTNRDNELQLSKVAPAQPVELHLMGLLSPGYRFQALRPYLVVG